MEEKEFDYINIIPLVDVMLVLLTIVLTTSTFIAAGSIPIELPKASESRAEVPSSQTIEINRNGLVFFNGRPVSILSLRECMAPLDRSLPILMRVDRDIAVQKFVDVLDTVKKLEFKRVSLQTESGE